jgi:hypothetical protein
MKQIIQALLKAQKEFPTIERTKTAHVPTKAGGKFSYSYADLAEIVNQCTPVLHKNDLVLYQTGTVVGAQQALKTTLAHTSGEFIESEFLLPGTDDPQDAGASITYFRRYAMIAALGIVTEDDSDAATVAAKKPSTPASVPSARPQQPASDIRPNGGGGRVTEKQVSRLFAIKARVGMPDDVLKGLLKDIGGVESSKDLHFTKYNEIVAIAEGYGQDQAQGFTEDQIPF